VENHDFQNITDATLSIFKKYKLELISNEGQFEPAYVNIRFKTMKEKAFLEGEKE
jgi:hypothetical protein